jgi:hypothetical protein
VQRLTDDRKREEPTFHFTEQKAVSMNSSAEAREGRED